VLDLDATDDLILCLPRAIRSAQRSGAAED